MRWTLCKTVSDVWINKNEDSWEYIAVYINDLYIASRNTGNITKTLVEKYRFKLKEAGELVFY